MPAGRERPPHIISCPHQQQHNEKGRGTHTGLIISVSAERETVQDPEISPAQVESMQTERRSLSNIYVMQDRRFIFPSIRLRGCRRCAEGSSQICASTKHEQASTSLAPVAEHLDKDVSLLPGKKKAAVCRNLDRLSVWEEAFSVQASQLTRRTCHEKSGESMRYSGLSFKLRLIPTLHNPSPPLSYHSPAPATFSFSTRRVQMASSKLALAASDKPGRVCSREISKIQWLARRGDEAQAGSNSFLLIVFSKIIMTELPLSCADGRR